MDNNQSSNSSEPRSKIIAFRRSKDEPLQNVALFECAWDEFPELRVRGKDEWLRDVIPRLSRMDRYEVALFDGPEVVGGMVLGHDDGDPHVGPCFAVFTQYILPAYRNSGVCLQFMRFAHHVARLEGAEILAYTHRTGPWKYATTYRRVN